MKRHIVMALIAIVLAGGPLAQTVQAGLGNDGKSTDVGTSSLGTAALTNPDLVVGASGAYTPIPPANIKPGGSDPGSTASAAPPYPAPGCPGGFSYVRHSPRPMTYTIYPSFTRNAQGGYDGHDDWYGYNVPNAIQPGGNSTLTQDGYPATAANMAGHVIAVEIEIGPTSTWPSQAIWWSQQTQGILGPDIAGTCDGGQIRGA